MIDFSSIHADKRCRCTGRASYQDSSSLSLVKWRLLTYSNFLKPLRGRFMAFRPPATPDT